MTTGSGSTATVLARCLAPLLLIVLAGCATMQEDECRTADWRDVGLRDGLAGRPSSTLASYHEACSKHGIVPDADVYREGRAEGLNGYCVLDNAAPEGLAGRRYQGVCPVEVDRSFRKLNDSGYAVYTVREEMDDVYGKIDSLENELADDDTTEERRTAIRDELRKLDREIGRLRDDLRWKERELDRVTAALIGASP
jgi:hypothetical protein